MKRILAVAIAAILVVTSGCASTETMMDFADVSETVLSAAMEAVPGLEIDHILVETTRRGIIYEVIGAADGTTYEIEIDENGNVLEVEEED